MLFHDISCGAHKGCAASSCGVYIWGSNESKCSSNGTKKREIVFPTKVIFPEKIRIFKVACGTNHTLFLADNGIVFSSGNNRFGQLGIGKSKSFESPQPILLPKLIDIINITTGHYHSIAKSKNGLVYTWGWNVHGQLGLNDIKDRFEPDLIVNFKNSNISIKSTSAGFGHSLFLTENGQIYATGNNSFGQLGCQKIQKSCKPVFVKFDDQNGIIIISLIATGYFHNLAYDKSRHQLFKWGECEGKVSRKLFAKNPTISSNDSSKKRNKNISSTLLTINIEHIAGKIIQIACGLRHSILTTDNSEIFVWGENESRQLGLLECKEKISPCALKFPENKSVSYATCFPESTLFISADGTKIFGCGKNDQGQLGFKMETDSGSESLFQKVSGSKITLKIKRQNEHEAKQRIFKMPTHPKLFVEEPREILRDLFSID